MGRCTVRGKYAVFWTFFGRLTVQGCSILIWILQKHQLVIFWSMHKYPSNVSQTFVRGEQLVSKPLHCCCALASVTEVSLPRFVHRKSLSRRLDVGGVPLISGDPVPHGLCSSPSPQLREWSLRVLYPVSQKAPFYTTGVQKTVHTQWFPLGRLQPVVVEFQTCPPCFQQTPLLVMFFAQAWQRDPEHLALLPKDLWRG